MQNYAIISVSMNQVTHLSRITRVHFIGIGGIGMSALARFMQHEKKVVSGSDRALTPITKALAAEGIQIFGEQVAANITSDTECVVYTEAMAPDHEEMAVARALGVPMMNYFEALGQMVNPYYLIAVAGTHGKTTTTAMLIDVFEAAGKDPTGVVGSLRTSTHSNYRPGKSKYAIVEACEYKQDFLSLKPDALVITNVEHEHVDYYKDLAAVQASFRTLVSQVNEGGVVVVNTSDPAIAPIVADAPVTVIDYMAYFDVTLPMKQPGVHNRLNAAAVRAAAKHEQLDTAVVQDALSNFAGTWRRFEYKGLCNGASVYDDYGHHPTELMATMEGARELYPEKRLVVAFEPHTYSRTAALFEQFARAFAHADRVLLLPIYAAREENTWGVTSRELAVKALEYNPNVTAVQSLAEAEADLRASVKEGDVVLIMGAGTITQLATDLTR